MILRNSAHSFSKKVILHIIIGLNTGGAEKTLLKICQSSKVFEHRIVSLTGFGELGPKFEEAGVVIYYIDIRTISGFVKGCFSLLQIVARSQPSLVQTWLYHSDLLSLLVKSAFPNIPVIWNLRHSTFINSHATRTKVIRAFLTPFSWVVPRAVVTAGNKVRLEHLRIGYDSKKLVNIPNGIDLRVFYRSNQLRAKVRECLGVKKSEITIGFIGKFDPQKGVNFFLDAVKLVVDSGHQINCLMIGKGLIYSNLELLAKIEELGLSKIMKLKGPVNDVNKCLNALDLIVSASLTEGFPNVIAESIASGVPVVATDVGESDQLVLDKRFLVSSGSATELASAITLFLNLTIDERKSIRNKDYLNLCEKFTLKQMVHAYETLWEGHAR